MSGFWLRCDACNKELKAEADQEMALVARFKPSLFRRTLDLRPGEHLFRCRSCGWINVFAPAGQLTQSWRADIVTK